MSNLQCTFEKSNMDIVNGVSKTRGVLPRELTSLCFNALRASRPDIDDLDLQ
jgi:hypothetical protein